MVTKAGDNLRKKQKRTIYIFLVMLLMATFTTLIYLIFILINTQNNLVSIDDKQTEMLGAILFIVGGMLGVPIGKKWWYIVYVKMGRGAFLKVKKVKK